MHLSLLLPFPLLLLLLLLLHAQQRQAGRRSHAPLRGCSRRPLSLRLPRLLRLLRPRRPGEGLPLV